MDDRELVSNCLPKHRFNALKTMLLNKTDPRENKLGAKLFNVGEES